MIDIYTTVLSKLEMLLMRTPLLKYNLLKRCILCVSNKNCTCNINNGFNRIGNAEILIKQCACMSTSLANESNKKYEHYLNRTIKRSFYLSNTNFGKEPLKPSSKVEATVENLKKKKEISTQKEVALPKAPDDVALAKKKSIKQKIIDECVHYYHGFRLLFIDIKISCGLIWRVLNGHTLTRREYRLLIRTTGDMFRLVPFSVFIIVPFMEFLLPFFIKFFPGMLPSTFQTASEEELKMKNKLKVKIEMAKFLQETLDNMALQHIDHKSEEAKQFREWFHKIRSTGEEVSNEEIMRFSKFFEDEITLDSLSRSQLIALCRVLEVQTLGTDNFLRFQLRMKLRSLAADDKMIQKEGINALNLSEVQQACRSRGMRAYGLSEERLRSQLSQWLDLSLNEKVPPSLLLLSRALMLPEAIPTSDKLKATISTLPDAVLKQTQAAIGEREGKIDNKVAIEVIKEQERKIKEERKEQKEKEMQKEKILPAIEPAIVAAKAIDGKKEDKELQSKDIEIIESAIENISTEKKFLVEKEELQDLKEEMQDYKEDVEDLAKCVSSQPKPEIYESKAAKRLFSRVNKMINKLDKVLVDLNEKEKQLKKDLETEETELKKQELVKIDDIIAAIKRIKDVPDQSRLDKITKVLRKIDDDLDGSVKIEDVLKVIEIIGKENVNLTDKQVDELIELIDKEEILEVEDKIEKALKKDVIEEEEKIVLKNCGVKSTDSNINVPPTEKQDKNKADNKS